MKQNRIGQIRYSIESLKIHWKDEQSEKLENDIIDWIHGKILVNGLEEQAHWYAYDEDYNKDIWVEFDVKLLTNKS